jgi:hypothetical protein
MSLACSSLVLASDFSLSMVSFSSESVTPVRPDFGRPLPGRFPPWLLALIASAFLDVAEVNRVFKTVEHFCDCLASHCLDYPVATFVVVVIAPSDDLLNFDCFGLHCDSLLVSRWKGPRLPG